MHEIPAHGSLRFATVLTVPASLESSRQLIVTWHLEALTLLPSRRSIGNFTLIVA